MVFNDRDLILPSLYAFGASMVLAFLGLIPLGMGVLLFGDSPFFNLFLFVVGTLLVLAQFVVSYIFSAMTVYLIYGYLAEGDGRLDKAWAIVRRDFFDLLTLALASTAVNLLKSMMARGRRRMARAASGLLQTLWTEAAYLVLPAMVIDDLNLADGLKRVWHITQQNLLLIGLSTVGVRWVTGLIAFVLGVSGALFGFGVASVLIALLGSSWVALVIAIGLGALIFFTFVSVASVIGSYTATAYHTCLYLWARDVEKARAAQQTTVTVPAPAPLAAVLG
jgi:hypothetical protein